MPLTSTERAHAWLAAVIGDSLTADRKLEAVVAFARRISNQDHELLTPTEPPAPPPELKTMAANLARCHETLQAVALAARHLAADFRDDPAGKSLAACFELIASLTDQAAQPLDLAGLVALATRLPGTTLET
jgi:hypothetical protein